MRIVAVDFGDGPIDCDGPDKLSATFGKLPHQPSAGQKATLKFEDGSQLGARVANISFKLRSWSKEIASAEEYDTITIFFDH